MDSKSGEQMRIALEQRLGETLGNARPAETSSVPPPIPDHTLLKRIGRGAYGEVWLARNALGTLRAVKVVYRARFKEERPYEREFNGILKYEPVSRTHEGLVQVLHVGRNDEAGCFYYVMELADDSDPEQIEPADVGSYEPRTLRSELAACQRLSPADAAQFALRLTNALAHLHTHGLVHRDVKPSNVIFVSGRPKLADIGLVTDVGSSQSFVGTEGFIPPEGPGTPQADLYGMGKLLYELATGRDRMDFPQLPPAVMKLPDGEALLELNEVLTRACAPNPQQRYASANELQADLNLFLSGRSLRRARDLERHLARLKRFAFVASAFLVLAAVVIWFSKREERHAREKALQADERARTESALRQRAQHAEHQREMQLYTALLEQARATVRSEELGQRVRALDAVRRAAAISNSAELRREAVAALALPDFRLKRELPARADVTMARFDPKFERVALFRGRGPLEVRGTWDDCVAALLPPSTNLPSYAGSWSADGRFLAVRRDYDTTGHGGDLEIWEMQSLRLAMVARDIRWNAWSFHPRRPQLLTGGTRGRLVAWDLETGKPLASRTFPVTLQHVAYSPDGERVAAIYPLDAGWGVSVHEAVDGALVSFHAFATRAVWLDWHPGGQWLGIADRAGMVWLMDVATGELRSLGSHKAEAVWVSFEPGGRYLVSGGWEREMICWDLQTMQRALSMPVDGFQAQFSADGTYCGLLSTSGPRVFAFERPNVREFAEELGPRLRYAAFSPNGRWLAASGDRCLGVWEVTDNGSGAIVTEAAEARPFFTGDSRELFGTGSGECFRWRITAGTDLQRAPQLKRLEFDKPAGFTSLCTVSNTVVITGSQGSRLLGTEKSMPWKPTASGVNGLSPDGRWLGIYAPFGLSLDVYRVPDLTLAAQLYHGISIGAFQFSPSGDEVAIGSRGKLEFWSTTDWKRTRIITNSSRILYSTDARTCWLTRHFSGSAGLHLADTLEPLLPLAAGTLPLALSPDGRHLAVGIDARRLHLWDLALLRERLRELGLDWQD